MRPRSVTKSEAQEHEQDEERDLGRGQQVLHDAPRPDTAHVHERQQHDERDGDQRLRRHGKPDRAQAALEERARVGGGGNESSQVEGESHGAGGNRARESRHEGRPAGQKRGQRPEGLAQVDVLPASLWQKRGQLGIGHGARKRNRAAEQPDRHHGPRIAHQPRDDRRREEDASPDDVADDDGGRVERAQAAFED